MATKQLRVVRAGLYGTRMLKAGDAFEATGPEARLFEKLGWMTAGKPAKAAPVAEPVAEAPTPKRAPRKRKAKKTA